MNSRFYENIVYWILVIIICFIGVVAIGIYLWAKPLPLNEGDFINNKYHYKIANGLLYARRTIGRASELACKYNLQISKQT